MMYNKVVFNFISTAISKHVINNKIADIWKLNP
jgi:hypothetical protein